VIAVATAEEMPVNETLALQQALADELGQRFAGVVVNGVLPARFTKAEAEALDRAQPGSRAIRAARAEAGRSRGHRAQLARLRRGLHGVEVRSLPFLFATELGPVELTHLAKEILK
jgi:hypothetical protein